MIHKDMPWPRRWFRYVLYTLAAVSFLFFSSTVYLHINDGFRWKLTRDPKARMYIFKYDVAQHYVIALFKNDDGKYKIANALYNKNMFSRIYGNAGIKMMEQLARNGHPPAQVRYAFILETRTPTKDNLALAKTYYERAASAGYAPAIEKLAAPDSRMATE